MHSSKRAPASTIGFGQNPKQRNVPGKDSYSWLEDKLLEDGAEGLWRVNDSLYDLTDYMSVHPGGRMWLEFTKGTDITEAFEAHHISTRPEKMLPQFFIRKAKTPRNSPFTFHSNGFYKTLKANVRDTLSAVPLNECKKKTALITDIALTCSYLAAIAASYFWSYLLASIAAYFMVSTTFAGHNYFHQKDNFRMYYFELTGFSFKEWRISHVISHHLLTNSTWDLEISLLEPLFDWLPKKKSTSKKILTLLGSAIFWFTVLPLNLFLRVKGSITKSEDRFMLLIPFSVVISMYLFGGRSILETLQMWLFILVIGSLIASFVALNAAHHHPDIFHDGDKAREDKDWGIWQLNAVMDRTEVTGSNWLVLTTFGDHAMHHLFPTMDHTALKYLYPVFEKTAKQFNVDIRFTSWSDLVIGQFKQLLRTKPNPEVTDLLKYTKNKKFVKYAKS